MRRSIQQPNAMERARVAYDQMMRRQRAVTAERRQRERSRFAVIVSVLVGMLALAVGVVTYYGWLPSSWRSSTLTVQTEDDFVRTRTGQVRSFVRGDTCRDLHFSNDAGAYVAGKLVPCQSAVKPEAAPMQIGADRLNSIRGAFIAR